jgi:hypothetical protein
MLVQRIAENLRHVRLAAVHRPRSKLDLQRCRIEHQFAMASLDRVRLRVHRTASIRLRVTRRQADRCYRFLRSGGDVWAWLIDTNRQRQHEGKPPVASYQALCKELTGQDSFGELSAVGARSVLRRYSCAWSRRSSVGDEARMPGSRGANAPWFR